MLRWWFVDGVSKSSTGASFATSSATNGELSVDGIDNCTIIQQSIGARTLLFLGEGKGYDYMENYMKNLEYKKLSEYLEFKKR